MKKVGILGGGQLGRMLLQVAANYPVETYILENDVDCPAAHLCHHFIKGDINHYETVYQFGKMVDVLTIEIEHVNIEALQQLEEEGLTVIPNTKSLKIIKDKVLQKEFYKKNEIETSDFIITSNQSDLHQHLDFLPAVHKLGSGGYDGKGVQLIHNAQDINKGFNQPAVLEKMVSIQKEIAIMVAVDCNGQMVTYPAVDMVFDPQLNLLDYQLAPATLSTPILEKAKQLAINVVQGLNSAGVFAVELFVNEANEVLVNETAPRVHNSGHHTIEANYASQFDMLWRILLQYPLGNPAAILPAAIVNIVGEPNFSGEAVYEGLETLLQMNNLFVHLYGKKFTKPGRKMGHVTIIGNDQNQLIEQIKWVKNTLKVKSK
ncbi:MAG: 5-(carboxyamino)imidazole ribonucleotide synthase [Ferruginibacter sp.]